MYLIPISVKSSSVEGRGVFSEVDISEGEIVWNYTVGHDKSLSQSEYETLTEGEKEYMNKVAYLSSTSGQYVFPPENDPALYTNHDALKHNLTVVLDKSISPEPFFIANRDIKKGEELTNNYHEFDNAIGLNRSVPEWLRKITLKNRKGQKIVGVFTKPEGDIKGTCVIEHGWSGSKEQSHILAIQEAFLENGFQTFNFDATNSFNESDGEYEKSRLGLHYEDMEDVCKWVRQQEWFTGLLAISGHSMGGYATVRYAEEFPDEVGLIAPIAPVVSGTLTAEAKDRYSPGVLQKWKEDGVLITESSSTPGLMKHSPYEVHVEWLNHDLLPNAHKLTIPAFLLTGSKDTSCPPDHVKQLFDAMPEGNKMFEVVDDAPHTYVAEGDLKQVKSLLSRWLKTLYETK